MPQLKFMGLDSAEEATISNIHVQVGQEIKTGDKVFDIEADKASDTVTSPFAGKISSIKFKAGDNVKINDVVIEIDNDNNNEKAATPNSVQKEKTTIRPQQPISDSTNQNSVSDSQEKNYENDDSKLIAATPIARKIARELGIKLDNIKGTGPFGRILQADVEKHSSNVNNKSSSSSIDFVKNTNIDSFAPKNIIDVAKIEKFGEVMHMPLSGLRKAIANQMSLSVYTAPHVTLFIDVDAAHLIELRTVLKNDAAKPENGAIKLTFMPFFVKAIAKVLTEERFALFNSTLDLANNEILVKKYFNIGMAADTEKGLVVPVIKNANKITLLETAKIVNELADKARKGQLKGEEMSGGTFTITNFGSAGLKSGTPVINYPEVAILGIGALESRPVIVDDKIAFHSFFPLSLSIDHRVIDGAPAGYFLNRIKQLLENPALILA